MVWYSHLFQNFPQFIVIHTVKGFGIVHKAEIDVFLELSCFFDDPADVGNLISGSSAFSKTSLNYGRRFVTLYRRQGLRPSPRKRNAKKAKWLSEEALGIVVKRREAKSKGEKEGYKHLNAEFQRKARRDKKAFLRDQCKEIEENNRMGKTRDLFKEIRDTREHFMQRWAR